MYYPPYLCGYCKRTTIVNRRRLRSIQPGLPISIPNVSSHIIFSVLLLLQLIMQIQARMADSGQGSLLSKPDHFLPFIKHALTRSTARNMQGHARDFADSDSDSDDETPDSESFTPDDEMTETSVNLLLALLEGGSTEQDSNQLFNRVHQRTQIFPLEHRHFSMIFTFSLKRYREGERPLCVPRPRSQDGDNGSTGINIRTPKSPSLA